jgi:hypothetical protein
MFFWLLEVSAIYWIHTFCYVVVQEQYGKEPITHNSVDKSLVESQVHERMTTNGRMKKAKQGRSSSCPPHED